MLFCCCFVLFFCFFFPLYYFMQKKCTGYTNSFSFFNFRRYRCTRYTNSFSFFNFRRYRCTGYTNSFSFFYFTRASSRLRDSFTMVFAQKVAFYIEQSTGQSLFHNFEVSRDGPQRTTTSFATPFVRMHINQWFEPVTEQLWLHTRRYFPHLYACAKIT